MTTTDLIPTRTGELLNLKDATTDQLADALDNVKTHVRQGRDITTVIEAELNERLRRENLTTAQVGEWIVTRTSGRTRVWDADELEGVLQLLVDRDVISAKAAADVIHREVKVSGKDALRLLGTLDAGDRADVEACVTWKQGKPGVKVERA